MEIPVKLDDISVLVRGVPGRCSEFTLSKGEVYQVSARMGPVRIQCTGGVLWVTQENDPNDYLLEPSQQVTLAGPGPILVQSLPRGKMCITTGLPS